MKISRRNDKTRALLAILLRLLTTRCLDRTKGTRVLLSRLSRFHVRSFSRDRDFERRDSLDLRLGNKKRSTSRRTFPSCGRRGRRRHVRVPHVPMFNDLPRRRLISKISRKRFLLISATIFFSCLSREREFPSRDRRIAIYSNKRTADLPCERDGIDTRERKTEREKHMRERIN